MGSQTKTRAAIWAHRVRTFSHAPVHPVTCTSHTQGTIIFISMCVIFTPSFDFIIYIFYPRFYKYFFSFFFVFAVLSLIVISTSYPRNSLWQKQSIPGKITTFGINTAMSFFNRHSQSNSGLIDDQNNLGMYSKT